MIYRVDAHPNSAKYLHFWGLKGKYQILRELIPPDTADLLTRMLDKNDNRHLARA